MSDDIDYRLFYDDETYLLDVGQRFRESGTLDPVDFYMMLAWKANKSQELPPRASEAAIQKPI